MSFNNFYINELAALRSLVQETSRHNPALAQLFNTGGDQDLERVMEGFAFLAGRVREKLDDAVPEITHDLFGLLWPNYLRAFPSASIIQYQPSSNVTQCNHIKKGTFVSSVPVEGTACTFQTIYDTDVLPLRLESQTLLDRSGPPKVSVRFSVLHSRLNSLPLSNLRFFFAGPSHIAHTLYFTLLKNVKEIHFVAIDANQEQHTTAVLSKEHIKPVGFNKHEGMYPYSEHTRLGHRIIQEYFLFPEKFLFVDVGGLDKAFKPEYSQVLQEAKEFELHFILDSLPPHYEEFTADNWRLFCTPVVNLFPLKTVPLSVSEPLHRYKVSADAKRDSHFPIYSIDKVLAMPVKGKKSVEYYNTLGEGVIYFV